MLMILGKKEKMELQVNFLESNKDIKMVYSNFYLLDQSKGEKNIQT